MGEPGKGRPSRAWYLLPIVLHVVGGVIAYYMLKDRDQEFAERLSVVGLLLTVVCVVGFVVLLLAGYGDVVLDPVGVSASSFVIPAVPFGGVSVVETDCKVSENRYDITFVNGQVEPVDVDDITVILDGVYISGGKRWSSGSIGSGDAVTLSLIAQKTSVGESHNLEVFDPGSYRETKSISC